jgi:hypothetical protein
VEATRRFISQRGCEERLAQLAAHLKKDDLCDALVEGRYLMSKKHSHILKHDDQTRGK